MRQEFDQHCANTDKQLKRIGADLDTKATYNDLTALQQNMMDKLNELMGNMENMFADKDATRKKLAALEKAVK